MTETVKVKGFLDRSKKEITPYEFVCQLIQEKTGIPTTSMHPKSHLFDELMQDSISVVDILDQAENKFDYHDELYYEKLDNASTLEDLANYIESQIPMAETNK